ncbi:DUF2141 domain-containing protein [Aliikangiella coralliicola]|uniref:DUF2141 domain-containing protein n=2 Tax=Aliikangiella coralliicola TaxID=2592383 RepID=A0A545UK67_9GAMM|nr:DUF2141 domain-containing protein [Aliikangiella coralliicola]
MLSSPILAKDLTIRVSDIDVTRPGNIMVMLYSKDGYPKNHAKAVSTQNKPAENKTLEFIFNVDISEFAIKVLHDENMDGKVSKNWTGFIPAEGLGFSNGAKLNFGPPSFKKSKLELSEAEDVINISVIYP